MEIGFSLAEPVQSRESATDLLINDPFFRETLERVVRRITPNATLREDLFQEGMIHVWLTEVRRPGQTRSWYLQSCRFHMQHYLDGGRSIDSLKRGAPISRLDDCSQDDGISDELDDPGSSVLSCVNAREIIFLLRGRLSLEEERVLDCLADGMGTREIGRKLSLSHTMVTRHRRRIASLLNRLEAPAEVNGTRHSFAARA